MHPIREVLTEAGYRLFDIGDTWRTTALYRGGKTTNSLSINKKTGGWIDFGVGKGGSAEQLAKIIAGKDINFANYIPETHEIDKIKVTKTYPKDILRRLLPDYDLFLDRGISKETLDLFEAGLATSGKLRNRVCFPIYSRDKKIIGFTGRWFKENRYDTIPKWLKVGQSKEWLYPNHLNLEIIRQSREIIIVESVGDLLALWEAGLRNSLCIFGTAISSKQLSYIVGLDPERIIIATNNDEDKSKGPAAANKIKKKLTFLINSDKIRVALPTKNDFGDMSKEEIRGWHGKI